MSVGRVGQWVRRGAAGLLLVGALVLLPTASQANPLEVCEGQLAPEPEHAGTGVSALVESPQRSELDENDGYGRGYGYANYGTAGMQLHVITNSCVDPKGMRAENAIGSLFWGFTRIVADLTIFVYQLSASGDILTWLSSTVAKFIFLMRDGVWRPLIPTVTIIGAITLAYWGLVRKRATLTIEGALWMVLATGLGLWVTGAPDHFMSTATTITNSSTAIIHDTIGETMFQANGCPPTGLRKVPFQDSDSPEHHGTDRLTEVSGGGFESESNRTNPLNDPLWINSEMIYDSLVCQPYMMAVFGNSDQGKEAAKLYARQAISSGAFSRRDVETLRVEEGFDRTRYESELSAKEEDFRAVGEQVFHFYPEAWGAWSGHDAGHRLQASIVSAVGAVLGGLIIFIVSLAVLIHKVTFLLFLLASPVVFLIGIHPGVGRILVMRYLETLVGLLLMQVFVTLVQVVFLSLYGVLVATSLNWAVKIALMLALYVGSFIFRKKLAQGLASMGNGAFGRMMTKAANDKSLSHAANAVPGVAAYKLDKKAREKLSPIIGQALGTYLGGPMGGQLGRNLGEKNAARLRGDKRKQPSQAPPMQPQIKWTARDVTPQERSQAPPLRTQLPDHVPGQRALPGGPPSPPGGRPSGPPSPPPPGPSSPGGPQGPAPGLPGAPRFSAPRQFFPGSRGGSQPRPLSLPSSQQPRQQPRQQPTAPTPPPSSPRGYEKPVVIGNMRIYRPLK